MAKTTAPLLPATSERLRQFGERLRMARLRRRLSAKQVAERAGMNAMTLRRLERGGPGVTIGAYVSVMQVLGIDTDLDQVAKDDPWGREFQDSQLQAQSRTQPIARVSKATPRVTYTLPVADDIPDAPGNRATGPRAADHQGFKHADALATLLDSLPPAAKRTR